MKIEAVIKAVAYKKKMTNNCVLRILPVRGK